LIVSISIIEDGDFLYPLSKVQGSARLFAYVVEIPAEILTIFTGELALWLERLNPDKEDMSSNPCQDRTWALSEDLGSGLLQKTDFPIEKVPENWFLGELFTKVKCTFLKSV
jgi:hypothetical protein